jgi:hypothetical protein
MIISIPWQTSEKKTLSWFVKVANVLELSKCSRGTPKRFLHRPCLLQPWAPLLWLFCFSWGNINCTPDITYFGGFTIHVHTYTGCYQLTFHVYQTESFCLASDFRFSVSGVTTGILIVHNIYLRTFWMCGLIRTLTPFTKGAYSSLIYHLTARYVWRLYSVEW